MRAILLAAGYGTRLRPLTNTIPKCLVPIKGKPLLQIWLERLDNASVGPYLINTHYLSEQVCNFIEQGKFSNSVTVTYESNLLGTAGTLIKNLDFFQGQDGLLIHADNYCLANFKKFLNAHYTRPAECLMTMMTFKTEDPSSCGIVEIDKRGIVVGFHEKVKSPPGNLANGAIYILSAEAINLIKSELSHAVDFSTEILENFLGKIFTWENQDFFLDIGSVKAYEYANRK